MRSVPGFLLSLLIIFSSFQTTSFSVHNKNHSSIKNSKPSTTIKVGYYSSSSFQDYNEETNQYSGYSYEYFLAISQYTGWNYEFVKTYQDKNGIEQPLNFTKALELLENNELDIVNNVSKTTERDNKFYFSKLSSGTNIGYLVMLPEYANVAYEDFDSISHLKIGLLEGSNYNDALISYLTNNNVDLKEENIIKFSTRDSLKNAAKEQIIDAYISSSIQNENVHILCKFAPDEYYFAMPKANSSSKQIQNKYLNLISELNNAMDLILTNDPSFETNLKDKYYSNSLDKKLIFTEEEKKFINNNVVDIAFDPNWYPIIYKDKNNQPSGAIADLYKLISQKSGIKFNFISNYTAEEAFNKLSTGELSMITDIGYDYTWADKFNLKLTPPFLKLNLILTYQNKNKIDSNSNIKIALPKNYYFSNLIKNTYTNKFNYIYYNSVKDCLNAVKKGEADCTYISNIEYEYYHNLGLYSFLHYIIDDSLNYRLSIPISKYADSRIYTIINKTLNSISVDEINQIFYQTTLESQKGDFLGSIHNNPSLYICVIVMILTFIMASIGFIVYLKTSKKKNEKILLINSQLSDAISQANRANEAKSQFLSRMSHEIRTPMNAIVGLTEICKVHKEEPDKVTEYLDKINQSSGILLNIINDVLDMSAIENGKLRIANSPFNFKELINGINSIYISQCKQKNIDFEIDSTKLHHEYLIGDKLRINQIFLNLISNAYKFTPEGGSIKVTIKETMKQDDTQFFQISVKDTGVGMSNELQERLFKPFEQESASTAQKYGGSGLGLSITKNIITLMNGAIEVKSKKDQGTEFIVTLPLLIDNNYEFNNVELKNINVLIKETDISSLSNLSTILNSIKVNHCDFSNQNELINYLKTSNNKFNVLLFNWDNESNILLSKIKEFYQENIILIALADNNLDIIKKEASNQIYGIVSKPIMQSSVFNLLIEISSGNTSNHVPDIPHSFDFNHAKILLVEDNEINVDIALEILKFVNLDVDVARDGQEAIDKYISHPENYYKLILMDIQMPNVNGYDATKSIRKAGRKDSLTIPIIAMTANAFTEDISESLANGMNDHIAKPINTISLYSTISKYLKNK